jgi:hypothetical protein
LPPILGLIVDFLSLLYYIATRESQAQSTKMSTSTNSNLNQVSPTPNITKKSIKTPAKTTAIDSQIFICQHAGCQMSFGTYQDLRTHRRSHQPPVLCPHCQATIKHKSHLPRHIKRDCKKTPLCVEGELNKFQVSSLPPSSISQLPHVTSISLLPSPNAEHH